MALAVGEGGSAPPSSNEEEEWNEEERQQEESESEEEVAEAEEPPSKKRKLIVDMQQFVRPSTSTVYLFWCFEAEKHLWHDFATGESWFTDQ